VVAAQEARSGLAAAASPSGPAAVGASSSSSPAKIVEIPVGQPAKLWRDLIPVAVVLVALLIAVGLYYHSRSSKQLAEKDTIVLGDFTNYPNWKQQLC
jgi:hypothetical protein